jgi:hypothetical protein
MNELMREVEPGFWVSALFLDRVEARLRQQIAGEILMWPDEQFMGDTRVLADINRQAAAERVKQSGRSAEGGPR